LFGILMVLSKMVTLPRRIECILLS
jgi:hypothetical protein